MLLEVTILVLTIFLAWCVNDKRKHQGLPPASDNLKKLTLLFQGPFRFPILGNFPQLALKSRIPTRGLRQLSDQYGDVMHVQMGSVGVVVFSSHSALQELFGLEDITSTRKILKFIEERNMNKNVGLITSNGDTWKCLRPFTIRALREFGFGKSAFMDFALNEDVEKFVKHLKTVLSRSSDSVINVPHNFFNATVLNVLWRILTGHEYELDDAHMTKMLGATNDFAKTARVDDISMSYPVLRDWFPNWSGRNLQAQSTRNFTSVLQDIVKENEAKQDLKENPQCYIDVFLNMINKEKCNTYSKFNHTQLVYSLMDLFLAGAETTSKTLGFLLIYMIRNPEIQERVQKEIDSVWNGSFTLSYFTKEKLPLTSAVILELMRVIDVVPFPAPYESPKDFIFRGYRIPKGTMMLANIEAVHYEKSIWGDPDSFRPDRFISETGQLIPELVEYVIPFGKSKRACIGQSLAEPTIFMYFTSIMKHFKLEKVPGDPDPSTEPTVAFVYAPKPFNMKVEIRN